MFTQAVAARSAPVPLKLFHVLVLQEPILNVSDLKDIHSEIKFKVPEPVLFTNSHEGGDVVSVLHQGTGDPLGRGGHMKRRGLL